MRKVYKPHVLHIVDISEPAGGELHCPAEVQFVAGTRCLLLLFLLDVLEHAHS